MKKSLWKNNFKTIKNTRRRFISILVMAFLGVGFFSGLVATSPDMLDTLDKYTDNNKMYDIDIVSTLGLTKDDLDEINKIDGVQKAYGIQTKDSMAEFNEIENPCKIIEYNENINVPTVISGRLPENSDECLLDANYSINESAEQFIGKKITLQNDEEDENGNPYFTQKEFTVVGIAESPIYISSERGNTSIGSGKIAYFIYVKDDVIQMDYFTEIGVKVKDAEQEVTNSDAYLEKVNTVIEKIENIKEQRENARYDEMVSKIEEQIEQLQTLYGGNLELVQQQINVAKEEINKIEKPKWYIYDRLDNTGYSNIFDAIKTMSNISKLFPVIFYLVAVLISLTSMTRMIEEERIEIGTLKSLGYNNLQIISKYILYAFLACVIGGVIGMSVGFYLLPNIVWILYSMIYKVPEFSMTYRFDIGLAGIIISFICIGGATLYVAHQELKQMPSVLMRPKPPKNGKKILLEKIKFIWNKMTFSKKVTARNIFRYKKRAIMTIVGIAGCTGLMLTGFGIRDSVVDIPDAQFKRIFKYEASVSLMNTDSLDDLEEYLNSNENVEDYCKIDGLAGKLKNSELSFNITTFIPENTEEFYKICNLKNRENGEKIKLDNDGIIITDKIADELNIKVGDEVIFVDGDDIEYNLKIDGIVQNYVSHYVYMTKEFYENNINTFKTNMVLINTNELNDEEKNKLSEDILNINGVASVSIIDDLMKTVSDMLNTMNYVVVILIVASALLAFVVLYNLANINIGERQREIATLKVLGFYDKEVDNYINKENVIFTIVGIVLGLFFGTFLTTAIISSIEIDSLRFFRNINVMSYMYSAIITALFSVIVNWIIHFVLKKIDMIESLKSVE